VDQSADRAWRWQLVALVVVAVLVVVGITAWVIKASTVDHWLAVHTGTVNEPGPYYGFWSGFGSDIAELGILGGIATVVYQQIKKFNCHEPGCWRIGTHPAADGKFVLCYHHHPEFEGNKPTHDAIVQAHAEHLARQSALHNKLQEIHDHLNRHPDDKPSDAKTQ
jgi:hypothetical protein